MGQVIVKKLNGMSWTAKAGLVLLCTMMFSVFMYQGMFKPDNTQANVNIIQNWVQLYSGAAYPTGPYTLSVVSGTNPSRILVVAISSTLNTAEAQTAPTITYGDKTLSLLQGDAATVAIQHTYLYYLNETDIAVASGANITLSGMANTSNNPVFNAVYAAVYSGANAAALINTSYTGYPVPGNSTMTLSSALTANRGDVVLEVLNLSALQSAVGTGGNAPSISAANDPIGLTWNNITGSLGSSTNLIAAGNSTTPPNNTNAARAYLYAFPVISSSRTTSSQFLASGNASVSISAVKIPTAGNPVVTGFTTNGADPTSIYRADTGTYPTTVTLTGTGLTGVNSIALGSTTSTFTTFNTDSHIAVSDINVLSDTSVTVLLNADSTTTLGSKIMKVSNGASTLYTAANLVKSNLPAPTISSMTPNILGIGSLGNSSTSVTVNGANFQTGIIPTFYTYSSNSATTNVQYSDLVVAGDGLSLTMFMALNSSAAAGLYDIMLTNVDAKTGKTKKMFTANAAPTILIAAPAGLTPGSTSDIEFFGTGFASNSVVAIGNGTRWVESIGTTTYTNMNKLTLSNLKVFANATSAGVITFRVTNPTDGGSSVSGSIFKTIPTTGTTITRVVPNRLGANSGINNIRIFGTAFSGYSSVQFSSVSRGIVGKSTFEGYSSMTAPVTENGVSSSAGLAYLRIYSKAYGTYLYDRSSLAGEFYVTNAPTITSLLNGTTAQAFGQINTEYDLTINGTNIQSGATVALINPLTSLPVVGVTITNVTAVSATQLTFHIAIAAGVTEFGLMNLTITNPDFGYGTSLFNIQSAKPPSITSITPATIGQGATSVVVTINGANFSSSGGNPTVRFGSVADNTGATPFFTTNLVEYVSDTQLKATLTISTGATAATYDVAVINNNNEAAVSPGGLTVATRPGTFTMKPNPATLGYTGFLNISTSTAVPLVSGGGFNIVGDAGVTVDTPTVTSATQAQANVTISSDYNIAALGNHTITLTNANYGTRQATLSVVGAQPTVTSITPNVLRLGATAAPVTIVGTNFYPGATVSMGNSTGITVTNPLQTSPTTITANVTLTSTATAGIANAGADVRVLSGGLTGIGTALLTTTAAPAVISATPAQGGQGATMNVVIAGSAFDSDSVVTFSGTGITVNTTQLDNAGQITVNITIASDATLNTSRTITVTQSTNGGSSGTGGTFVVKPTYGTTITGPMVFPTITNSSILLSVPFTGDGNGDGSCAVKYGDVSSGSYPTTATAVKNLTDGVGTCTATITGLSAGSDGAGKLYYFQATFTNANGIFGTNPVIGKQPTRASALMHNSQNTNTHSDSYSTKYEYGWGIPDGKYGTFTCSTCHNRGTSNISLAASNIKTPSGGIWGDYVNYSTAQVIFNSRNSMGSDSTHTTSNNVCEVCHSQTTYHKYNNAAANHKGTVDCSTCHTHKAGFYPDPTLACNTCHSDPPASAVHSVAVAGDSRNCFACHISDTQNTKQHFAAVVPVKYGCTVCHASPQAGTHGAPRDAVTGEFGLAWGHKKSGRGTVTDADCVVCHLEGDTTTGAVSQVYHGDGNIHLRAPDGAGQTPVTNISGGAFVFSRFSTSYAAGSRTSSGHLSNTDIANVISQNFCLACHDSNGATNPTARSGAGATANMPWGGVNLGANYTTTNDASVAGGVVNVKKQFALTNSSKHPVLGPVYRDLPLGNETTNSRLAVPYDAHDSGRVAGGGIPTNSVVLNCFDCHNVVGTTPLTTRTVAAHGNAVSLRGSIYNFGGASTLCTTCHTGYTTTGGFHNAGSAWAASGSSHNVARNCQDCHGSPAPTASSAPARPLNAQNYHGNNALVGGGLWPTVNSRPYAFIRAWTTGAANYHRPYRASEFTTGTATCGGGGTCPPGGSAGQMGDGSDRTYTPGGTY